MIRTKGSIWKTGTKDEFVYFEIWNGLDTERMVDGQLTPTQAYNIGKSLMDNVVKQGYQPPD